MKITKLLSISLLTLASLFILSGCNTQTVSQGDTVTVTYDSFLENGQVVESGKTITFTVGMGQTFPIFDQETIGMKKGESKTFTAQASEGYGIYHDANKVQDITIAIFDKIGHNPKVGETIKLGDLEGLVLSVGPITDKIDFNEIQTREPVEFKIKIIDLLKD